MAGRGGRGRLEQRAEEHVAGVGDACVPGTEKDPPELSPGHLAQSAEEAPGLGPQRWLGSDEGLVAE